MARQLPDTRLVCVMDREADFFELFDEQRNTAGNYAGKSSGRVDLLVRAKHDRDTTTSEPICSTASKPAPPTPLNRTSRRSPPPPACNTKTPPPAPAPPPPPAWAGGIELPFALQARSNCRNFLHPTTLKAIVKPENAEIGHTNHRVTLNFNFMAQLVLKLIRWVAFAANATRNVIWFLNSFLTKVMHLMSIFNVKRAMLVATLVATSWLPTAQATPFPGPDAFGYSGAGIAYNFRDISTTGTAAFGTFVDDTVSGPIGIGFNFSFYGTNYTNAFIGSNGFITFSSGQSQGCCNGGPLPGTGNPSNLVAGWFTDLVSNAGQIRYQTLGSAGSREFIVDYVNNPYFSSSATNTFEIILHEGSNDVELQYDHTSVSSHRRSVGIENLGGTTGLQRLFDNTTTLNQEGICISTGSANCSTQNVPEPSALALIGLGLAALRLTRRKQA